MQTSTPWGLPNVAHHHSKSTPNRNPFHAFSRTISIANLQSSWSHGRPSSASSTSSSAYDSGVFTPTASRFGDQSRTRTPTPTTPGMSFAPPSREKANATSPTNPWAKILAAKENTPSHSPGSSSPSSRTPEDLSRSATPTP